jgi:hypothetical protein
MRPRLSSPLLLAFGVLSLQCGGGSDDSGAAPSENTAPARAITECVDVIENVRLDADLSTADDSCLAVKASNVTVDGNGHHITAGTFAIQWIDQSGVTVKNVLSEQALQISGAASSGNMVRDSTFGSVAVFQGDDNVIRNSRMQKLAVHGESGDPAQRMTITENVIEGTLNAREQKLVEIVTGTDGTFETDGTIHCAEAAHQITNNQILGTVVADVEPELLNYRCGTGSTISGNTIRTGQRAAGILLRDGADGNLIENNDVRIGDGNEGALLIQAGSAGYHQPRDNTIIENVFRVDAGRAFWLQAGATRGNRFMGNLFRSDSGTVETVRLTDGTGVDTSFDHNTFHRAGQGVLVVFRDLGPGINRFTSNIFSYGGGANGVFGFDHLQSFAGYTGDHNVFFDQGGAVTFGASSDTLCEWISATGQDQSSLEGDPRFVNPAGDDFGVASDSAARCAGENATDAGAFPSNDATPCPVIAPPCS